MHYIVAPLLVALVASLFGGCTRPADETTVTPPTDSRNVTTFAGSGRLGDRNGQADSAQFCFPRGLAFDAAGILHVADNTNDLIRKVSPDRIVTTLAGAGYVRYIHGPANGQGRQASFTLIKALTFDTAGNCYAVEESNWVRKITPDGTVSTFAALPLGNGNGLAFDKTGDLYVSASTCLYRISPAGKVTLFSGQPGYARGFRDGSADSARFVNPASLAFDQQGNLFVADMNIIRKVAPDGSVTTFAGYEKAVVGRDGTGTNAGFDFIQGLAISTIGDIYVSGYSTIRKVTPTGVVSTINGTDESGYKNGSLTTARFDNLQGIAFDRAGNLYVAEFSNRVIRKINLP